MKTYAAAIACILVLAPARCEDLAAQVADLEPTQHDRELIRSFEAFATEPTPETAAAVPFAPEVRLGLAGRLVGTVAADDVADPEEWRLELEYFRAHSGPFNALELVQRHGDDLAVSVGPHPHCASPPVPAPEAVEDLRRVSLQPATRSIDSCLDWFTVDLFVNDAGTVRAVTLDLWEP